MTGTSRIKWAFGLAAACVLSVAQGAEVAEAVAPPEGVPVETDGVLAVEAEAFAHQRLDEVRAWHLVDEDHTPDLQPDPDPPHFEGASGGAYLEILPDTRRTHGDPLVVGESFSNEPGKLAILDFPVWIHTPGRYYVWARIFSTGSEDNGLHVGLDGEWPASGQRMQWCEGKHDWRWESKQRVPENHCGVPYTIWLDIEEPGLHTISFSMREDGVEFDRWLITQDRYEALAGPEPEADLPEPLPDQPADD